MRILLALLVAITIACGAAASALILAPAQANDAYGYIDGGL